jgi:hypothetical protein
MFTKDEIEHLNRPAKNNSRLRHDEAGVDWDAWRFYPRDAHGIGGFTDGHDYGGLDCAPLEGWELLSPVVLPDEAVKALLNELHNIPRTFDKMTQPLRRVDREKAGGGLWNRMRRLADLLRG